MSASTTSGMSSGQLLARNPSTRSKVVGSATSPLFQPTTAVSPSWKPSGCGMATLHGGAVDRHLARPARWSRTRR